MMKTKIGIIENNTDAGYIGYRTRDFITGLVKSTKKLLRR